MAPGLMSAGLGNVLPDQTYLDIGQGARAFNSLYDEPLSLGLPSGDRIKRWSQIVARAESAPGSILPGLLTSYLNLKLSLRDLLPAGRFAVELQPELVLPALMGADRHGFTARSDGICGNRDCLPPVLIRNARLKELPGLVRQLEGRDLLIAIERPPPEPGHMLAMGIAGEGFAGNLTSGSTRTDGYVLSTDIAPTVIDRFGLEVPSAMTGKPIRSTAERDAAALVSLEDRMSVVAARRGPVIGVAAGIWIALIGLVALFDFGKRRRRSPSSRGPASLPRLALGLRLLTLAAVYLPTVLLFTSAVRPDLETERLLVLFGAPLLAGLTLFFAPGLKGLAISCEVTVVCHAIDVLNGSSLISLSLMGPNPGLGVRFYGIGNELGATLSVLLMIGLGAGLSGFFLRLGPKRTAAAFVAGAIPFAAIFAAGRFGADVGSAMVIPASAVVAAAIIVRRPLLILLAFLTPIVGLACLAAIDLISGGDSHFQRSVLDSEGGSMLETVGRRLQLTGRSFVRGASGFIMPLTALVIGLAIVYRGRIRERLAATPPPFRAGVIAAGFAALIGTVLNDSGVLLLEVGTAYLLLVAGYVWAGSDL